MKFAKVVVDLKNNQLNNFYDYSIPEALEEFICVGSRVLVSFGFQEIMGYVIEINENSAFSSTAKPLLDCLDYDQELSKEQVDLALYISKLMHVTVISVFELMIPSFLKGQKRKYIVVNDYNKLHPELANLFKGKERLPVDNNIKEVFNLVKDEMKKGNITLDYDYYTYGKNKKKIEYYSNPNVDMYRSLKRKSIYDFVSIHDGCSIEDITSVVNCSYSLVKDMVKDDTLYTKEVVVTENDETNDKALKNKSNYQFTLDEEATWNKFYSSNNDLYLLHSNNENFKAAIYARIIEDAKRKGEQVLITCPTIILQEEILMYLKRNLEGYLIYGITSKNTKAEKYDAYMNIKYNACDCLVTTQNGIFLPFNKLGTIIVVDEGNLNYINENYPYYRSCDVIEYRAKYHNAKVLYVSTSPSINTYYRVEEGKIKLLENIQNIKSTKRVINMKMAMMNGENEVISNYLKARMTDTMNQGGQVMLLVNSKAYSNMLVCNTCGKIMKCPKCNITLTYYKEKDIIRCNYCDHKQEGLDKNSKCSCGGTYKPFGYGQERISEIVSEMFPNKRILNVNADLMKKTDDYNNALIDIEEQRVDIIIGTSILTKSINADNIKLVGLVDFDNYLLSSSHRANEQSYNYIAKLANKREIVIQSFNVENEILKTAIAEDYYSFYKKEIENRKALGYEPFNEVNRITVSGEFKEIYHYANYFKKVFGAYFRNSDPGKTNCLGPSYDYRIKGIKLIIKHNDINRVYDILDKGYEAFKNSRILINFERYPKVM